MRDLLNRNPIWFNEPLSWRHVISDAFFWRNDNINSKFDLMNMYSLIVPEEEIVDRVRLIFMGMDGREVKRSDYELQPHEIKSLPLSAMVKDIDDWGTFFVFHSCEKENQWSFKTCLTDRGYTAFKKNTDDSMWSYVHGCCNTLVLAYDMDRDYYYPLSRKSIRTQIFRPQLRFDDCRRFEVMCSNPLIEPIEIVVRAHGPDHRITSSETIQLDGLASNIVNLDHRMGVVARIEVESPLYLYRPLIFKYYPSYFDVLHS